MTLSIEEQYKIYLNRMEYLKHKKNISDSDSSHNQTPLTFAEYKKVIARSNLE